jgi:ABC-type transporter Mla MlaB component
MMTTRALPAEVTIYSVGELKGQCLAWLGESLTDSDAGGDHWPLDASAVDQIDAAGVQLLVSLSHTLQQQGQPLHLLQPGSVLVDACAALGLSDWLAACTPEGAPA